MTGHFEATLRSAAARLRSELVASRVTPAVFNAALAQISPRDRDAWLDFVWDIDELPSDTPDLPKGLCPFLEGLQDVARARKIRVCCVDMPPLEVAWLKRLPSSAPQIDLYRSA